MVFVMWMVPVTSIWAAAFWNKDAKYDACVGDVRKAYYEKFGAFHADTDPMPLGGWTLFMENKTKPGICDCVRRYPNGSVSKFDKMQYSCPV